MRHVFELDGVEHRLWLSRQPAGYRLHLGDGSAGIARNGERLCIDGMDLPCHVACAGDRLFVHVDGEAHELTYRDPVSLHAAGAGSGAQDILRAPMPGAVVSLSVAAGQAVRDGDILMVIESMKLETAIRAPRDGVVETVHVALAGGFERDAPLVSLVPPEPQA